MVNVNKLRGKMVENEMNVETLAERIGIDRGTLYRKLNCEGQTFTVKEADKIIKELQLTEKETIEIFFSQFVA